MRSCRQIKKFSKQAMEILIGNFDCTPGDFTLEASQRHRGRWPLEWTYWTAPCYWYGESDEIPATSLLISLLVDSRTTYDCDGKPSYAGPSMAVGVRQLIRQARKELKASA